MSGKCPNQVDSGPIGVNPPTGEGTRPIEKVTNGDTIIIPTTPTLADGTPATPSNSVLRFVLTDQRFSECIIWEGAWRDGIEEGENGVAIVKIPCCVSEQMRRGSFVYSMTVADKLGDCRRTVLRGSLLVEYEPTSPIHDIPYKDSCPEACGGIGPALSDRTCNCGCGCADAE